MANLSFTPQWTSVRQLELTDAATGGPGGVMNSQAQALGDRSEWLKNQLTALQTGRTASTRNAVLAGAYNDTTGALELLIQANPNTLRVQASNAKPFIFNIVAGFNEYGEVCLNYKHTAPLDLSVAGLNGSYTAFITYETAGNIITLLAASRVHVQNSMPTGSLGANNFLWYRPVDGRWYVSFGGSGGTWTPSNVLPLGEFEVGGGTFTGGLVVFPYRQAYYDETTPAGTVAAIAGTRAPYGGWLLCNGDTINRAEYSALFAEVGTTYGAGNGSTTFRIPDLRGYFIRGFDSGGTIDAGRTYGSTQSDALKDHQHGIRGENRLDGTINPITVLSSAGVITNTESTSGASETRPRNVAMSYYIKY